MANANFAAIGTAFTTHYYQTFDSQRVNLQSLYQQESLLTFEGEQHAGMQAIMTKLTTLNFQTVAHKVTTCDSQPSPGGGILVMVTGDLAVDGNTTTPLKFAQSFHLMPTQSGSWYIHNDMFRLNYC